MYLSWNRFVRFGWRRQALIVFAAAFFVRAGYVCVTGELGRAPSQYNEQVRMARYLLHGSGFVSPVGPERSDPSSWYTPGYITMIAAVFSLLGEDSFVSLATVRVGNLLAQAGAIALWVLIGRCLLGRRVAAVAAILMIVSPAISFKAGEIWDTFPTMLCGATVLAVFVLLRPRRWWSQMLTGGLCGAAALINPCFTACYPIWFVLGYRRHRSDQRNEGSSALRKGLLLQSLCVLIGFLLVITPWTVRNRLVFGEWFYLRGNFGMELWVGNAPWSDGYFFSVDGRRIHPVFDEAEAQRLVRRGEFGYFQDRSREAGDWLISDPKRFAKFGLRRMRWFWLGRFSETSSPPRALLKFLGYTLPGALAVVGALWGLAHWRRCGVLILTMIVFPVPYYLTILMVRYRLPIEPVILLLAALFLVELRRMLRAASSLILR